MQRLFRRVALVLGIDSRIEQSSSNSMRRLLENYGNNTGNLVFAEAIFRTLKNVRRSPYAFSNAEASECDVIVIAAANWLNPYSDFGNLADRLAETKRPVVIVGIGAQSSLERSIPELKSGTLKLVRLASETSALISVRGDFTQQVLESYGINNVQSTGCPSLLLSGVNPPKIDKARLSRPVSVHSTRHLLNMADPYQSRIYRDAYLEGLDLVLQSELSDLIVKTGGDSEDMDAAREVLFKIYKTDDIAKLTQYLREKAKMFFTFEDWFSYLKNAGPCVGTRIHGTVVALLAGSPAVLIAHDSRTQEMAEKMSIPYVLSKSVSDFSSAHLRELAAAADYEKLARDYVPYLRSFLSFFAANGLQVADEFVS
jgi:polysaccharide pyruvyl transferase WcaK-like protein